MFTAEIRINGALIGILHVHNIGTDDDIDIHRNKYRYKYEYYEPEVGIKEKNTRKNHVLGEVICVRNKGVRHVIAEIFKNLDLKD